MLLEEVVDYISFIVTHMKRRTVKTVTNREVGFKHQTSSLRKQF